MYAMKNTTTGNTIKATNVSELFAASGYSARDIESIYSVYRPSPSLAVKVLIENGVFVPVDGPDWFMALSADQDLIARKRQEAVELNEDYERELKADEFLRKQIISEMGAYDAMLAQIIKNEEWERVQFSSPERESRAKATAQEYWRIVSGELPQAPNSPSVGADEALKMEITEKVGGSAYMEDGSYRLSVQGDTATFQYYTGSGKSQALGTFTYNMRTGEITDLGKTGVGLTEKTVRGVLAMIRPLRKGEPFIPDRRR